MTIEKSYRTVIEPFIIKSVQMLRLTSREEREHVFKRSTVQFIQNKITARIN